MRGGGEFGPLAVLRFIAKRSLAKRIVVRVGHLKPAQQKRRGHHPMHRPLLIAAVFPTHEKLAAGNADQIAWFQVSRAHLQKLKTAASARWRPPGPTPRAPGRQSKTRGACASPQSCGRSTDKCTGLPAACRWAPGLR